MSEDISNDQKLEILVELFPQFDPEVIENLIKEVSFEDLYDLLNQTEADLNEKEEIKEEEKEEED